MIEVIYPFMTLKDGTEIVHSEMKADGKVKVYIEKPDFKLAFRYATCWLPGYSWENIYGFSENEIRMYQEIIEKKTQLIFDRLQNEKSK